MRFKKFSRIINIFLVLYLFSGFLAGTIALFLRTNGINIPQITYDFSFLSIIAAYDYFIFMLITLPFLRKLCYDGYINFLLKDKKTNLKNLLTQGKISEKYLKSKGENLKVKMSKQIIVINILEDI